MMRMTPLVVVLVIYTVVVPLCVHAMSISDAKALPDDSPITLSAKVVTYAAADFFYIEEDSRCTGIRVEMAAHGLAVGMRADVVGTMATNPDKERCVHPTSAAQTAAPNDTGKVEPVGLSNRTLGGSGWSVVGTGGQTGVTGGSGLNNVALLVKTAGRFTYVDDHTFTLSDGSGVSVTCQTTAAVEPSPTWLYLAATGISSMRVTGESTVERLLLVTSFESQFVAEGMTEEQALVLDEMEKLPPVAMADVVLPDGRSVQDVLDGLNTSQNARSPLAAQPDDCRMDVIAQMQARAMDLTKDCGHGENEHDLAYCYGAKNPLVRSLPKPQADKSGNTRVCPVAVYGLDCSGLVYQAACAAKLSICSGTADDQMKASSWNAAVSALSGCTMQEVDNSLPDFNYQTGDIVGWGKNATISHIGIICVKSGGVVAVLQSNGNPCYTEQECLRNRNADPNYPFLRGPNLLALETMKAQDCWGKPSKVLRLVPSIEMVHIPAGRFRMGNSGAGDDLTMQGLWNDFLSNEKPQREVYLEDYWIGKYEVTRGQYRRFMEATGHAAPQYWDPVVNLGTGYFTQTDDHPVVGVSWYDAEAFCEWAGGHLPTEAQWEKAARWDGHPRVYPWGDSWDSAKCNCRDDSKTTQWQTAPIGSYPEGASPYGCMDIAGNAWEWCWDFFVSYPGCPAPFSESSRCVRGGSYSESAFNLRCADRLCDIPYAPGYSYPLSGFRLAR